MKCFRVGVFSLVFFVGCSSPTPANDDPTVEDAGEETVQPQDVALDVSDSQAPDAGSETTEPADEGPISDGSGDVVADVPEDAARADTDADEPEDGLDGVEVAQLDVSDAVDSSDSPIDVGPPDTGPEDVEPPPPPYWILPVGYEQAHFEEVAVDNKGETDDLNLIVPEHTLSFTVMINGAPDTVYMRLNKLVSPLGYPLVVGQGNVICIPCKNRVYANHNLTTTLVPNSPEVKYQSKGKFKLKLRQFTITPIGGSILTAPWSDTPMTARILLKIWDNSIPSKGLLDLNLWFSGFEELNAEAAPTHPRVIKAIESVNAIFADSGIQVGKVNYLDLPEGVPQSVTTTLGIESDLSQLFIATGIDAPPGVNVVFVANIVKTELKDGSTGIVLGIAGGVPGPPFVVQGSPHSGVAVSLIDTLQGEKDILGSVLAHELGHYLGLFHTTEKALPDAAVTIHDPILDTAEFDPTNLMYWAAAGGTTLTEGQAFVMQRHPSVLLQPTDGPPDP